MNPEYRRLALDGLWHNNVVFAQMLALCPALAVTGSATNGLGMGFATTAVLIASGGLVSLLRRAIEPEIRIPVFVLMIATLVTLVDLVMNAFVHDLYKVLGLFIPLIVVNCSVLGRAESYAVRSPVLPAMVDGLMMGAGFTLALVLLGGFREVIGSGTLFANASGLLGAQFAFLEMTVIPDYRGFLLMILPPGGFIMLSLLLAGRRLIEQRRASAPKTATPAAAAPTSITI